MKYLKRFRNTTEIGDGVKVDIPNVSCLEDLDVLYVPGIEGSTIVKYNSSTGKMYRDYASEYLTFEALEDGTFTLTIGSAVTTTVLTSISYSINYGKTWVTTNNVNSQTVTITTPTIEKGNIVLWKGSGTGISTTTDNGNRTSTSSVFSATGSFNVYGNIMSLLYGDNFATQTSVTGVYNFALAFYYNNKVNNINHLVFPITNASNYCYFRMFQGCSSLKEAKTSVSATSLGDNACQSMFVDCTSLTTAPELPATTLGQYCYQFMFLGCVSLTNIPTTLPSTTLIGYCYQEMFSECSSLTTVPTLPATSLADACYCGMFSFCTSLTTTPALPATTLTYSCYQSMFNGCTSLTTAPTLPATTLANSCYEMMFLNCTSLTTAPTLSATTMDAFCYSQMFRGCTSLTTAPALPATTLAERCYQAMFYGCTSLTIAPTLPATTLVDYCYLYMFLNCSSLNEITCYATNISATGCTENWVSGVAATGTFKKNASMSSWTTGVNGIPSGWTVQNAP